MAGRSETAVASLSKSLDDEPFELGSPVLIAVAEKL